MSPSTQIEGREPAPSAPSPAPRGRRFATGWVWLGVLAGMVVSPGLLPLGWGVDFVPFKVLLGLTIFVPLVVGIALLAVRGDARRRGLGLGLLIGWGALLLVGWGTAVALNLLISGQVW